MTNGQPERAEGFVKLTRSAIDLMADRQLSTAAWRVLVFLVRELLRNGGKGNGNLKAPHRQLVAFGISAGLVTSAIKELEGAGLIQCCRETKAPSLFELTWLPRSDGQVRARQAATVNGGRFAR